MLYTCSRCSVTETIDTTDVDAMAMYQAARPDVYFWVEEVVNNETELP